MVKTNLMSIQKLIRLRNLYFQHTRFFVRRKTLQKYSSPKAIPNGK